MSSESGGRTGFATDDSEANATESRESKAKEHWSQTLRSGSERNSEKCISEL